MLIAFSYFYRQKGLYSAFGFNSQPILVGLIIIFQFVMAPYNDIMGIAQSFLSRKMGMIPTIVTNKEIIHQICKAFSSFIIIVFNRPKTWKYSIIYHEIMSKGRSQKKISGDEIENF